MSGLFFSRLQYKVNNGGVLLEYSCRAILSRKELSNNEKIEWRE